MDIINTNTANYKLLKKAIDAGSLIYVYGPSSSGKTYLTQRALNEDRSILSVHLDCNVISTSSRLYISILTAFKEKVKTLNLRKRLDTIPKVLALQDFLPLYQINVEMARKKGYEKIYIVLDRMELFRKTPMIDCLVALAGCDHLNLICISIEDPHDILSELKSHVNKNNFYDRLFKISLSPWTKSDIVDTICLDEAKKMPELYRKFVNNVVSITYTGHTRDFVEIKSFCQENYPQFYRFYVDEFKEIIKKKEKIKHELSDDDLDDFDLEGVGKMNIISSFLDTVKKMIRQKDIRCWNLQEIDRKVVVETSTLIVAAYIAAYTKPTDDKRNFVKFQKRKVLNRDRDRNHNKLNESMAISRSFTLERLLHIYKGVYASIGSEIDGNDASRVRAELPNSVLSDVQLLLDLGMIKVVSGDEFSSHTRYKISSSVARSYADRIAAQIEFSLDYIYGLSN